MPVPSTAGKKRTARLNNDKLGIIFVQCVEDGEAHQPMH